MTDYSYFGESLSNSNVQPSPVSAERSGDGTFNLQPFYIGKPAVEGVGKWQTADPMGYPENAPKRLCFGGKPRAQRSARRARKGPRCDCAQGSFPQELANLLNVPVVACDTKVEYLRMKDSATGKETVVVKAVLNNPLDQSVHWIRFNPE